MQVRAQRSSSRGGSTTVSALSKRLRSHSAASSSTTWKLPTCTALTPACICAMTEASEPSAIRKSETRKKKQVSSIAGPARLTARA